MNLLPKNLKNKISIRRTGCHEWTGFVKSSGYGQAWHHKKIRPAHRVIFEIIVKHIPNGLVLDHLCRNRKCVNVKHLEIVTQRENCRRGNTGKHLRIRRFCPQGHRYNKKNTHIYNGRRYCKICNKTYTKNYRHKKKEK